MLQTIRSKTHGVVAWIIVILVGFVFAVWGIEGYLTSDSNQAAKVNGEVITQQELDRTYQQILRQRQIMQALQGKKSVDKELLFQQVLAGMVSEKMLASVAHQQGFAVGKDQVDHLVRTQEQFQDNGTYSPEKFEKAIKSMGYSAEDFRAAVANDLIMGQARTSIIDSAFVLPNEFDRVIDLLEQKRDVQYVLIPSAEYLSKANVTDEQIRGFYDEHPADYMLPEQISVQYIRVNADDLTIEDPSDATLQEYYNTHLANYTEPEERHAAHILITEEKATENKTTIDALAAKVMQDAQNGTDFAELATQYSADPGSAKKGGDLGWFSRGVMVPEFEEAVFTAQPNVLAGPVKTDFGLHIIKVIEIKPEVVKPFDTVKEDVKIAWVRDQREIRFGEEVARLDALTFENPDQLDTAAQALNLPIEKTELFTRDNAEALNDLNQPGVIDVAFGDAVMLEDRNSEVIALSPKSAVVLHKLDYNPERLENFDTVKDAIKMRLASEQAATMAKEQADAWLAQLSSGATIAELNSQFPWVTELKTNRYNRALPLPVLNKAFELPMPDEKNKMTLGSIPVGQSDYAVVVVNGVYKGELDPANADAMREEYMIGLVTFKGELDYQFYVADAEKHSDIELFVNAPALKK